MFVVVPADEGIVLAVAEVLLLLLVVLLLLLLVLLLRLFVFALLVCLFLPGLTVCLALCALLGLVVFLEPRFAGGRKWSRTVWGMFASVSHVSFLCPTHLT